MQITSRERRAADRARRSSCTVMPPGKSWKRICLATPRTSDNIANGAGTNLLHRLADVALKEIKQLVILEREMPCALVHLKKVVAIRGLAAPRSGQCRALQSPRDSGKPGQFCGRQGAGRDESGATRCSRGGNERRG
jgi:flavin prenyltransferase